MTRRASLSPANPPEHRLSRRRFLAQTGAIGCSLAASPLVTPIAMASLPTEKRLVVIVLRGALDGLDLVQPYGDAGFASLRPNLLGGEAAGATDLDGFFALHPGFAPLMPLWQSGELGFAHAVSTPYRGRRSHSDGQDMLQTGGPMDNRPETGWLNRLLQTLPDADYRSAFSVGRSKMRILQGDAPVSQWAPNVDYGLDEEMRNLIHMVHQDDPIFEPASQEAIDIAIRVEADGNLLGQLRAKQAGDPVLADLKLQGNNVLMAQFAASRLLEDTRIVSFSINGWDTHRNQAGALKGRLPDLAAVIATLRSGLGDVWKDTAVLCVTEFGRTAAENGSRGTDHGTGGVMIYAGGALSGGRVIGAWPGLQPGDLYDGRDLMPTRDVRAHMAWVIHRLFGTEPSALEATIFPGLEMGSAPALLG